MTLSSADCCDHISQDPKSGLYGLAPSQVTHNRLPGCAALPMKHVDDVRRKIQTMAMGEDEVHHRELAVCKG